MKRSGLTLLEVVLAVAILAGSFVVLSQLVAVGVKAARNGRNLTRAQLLAESTMSEIVAGIASQTGGSSAAVGGAMSTFDPEWTVTAETQPTIHQGIVQVTVTAQRVNDSTGQSQFTLSRWLRDPSIEIPEEESEEEEDTDNSSSSTSTTSSNAGGTPNGTGPGGTP